MLALPLQGQLSEDMRLPALVGLGSLPEGGQLSQTGQCFSREIVSVFLHLLGHPGFVFLFLYMNERKNQGVEGEVGQKSENIEN